ncbi:MAG: hypothetical protein HYZ89_07435 [Candidatus Omnitrophica bacterium]|nr:hypothetical protein [Candidatus Omnitrophota bacterium]
MHKLVCRDGRPYLAKHYFHPALSRKGGVHHRVDARDRLAVEFSSLQFLWDHGVRDIPRPIAADGASQWAVYEYVEGVRVPSEEITGADIEMAVEFLGTLKQLQRDPASRRCPVASEACFSIQDIMEQLQERLARFSSEDPAQEHLKALQAFLREAFLPAWRQISGWCKDRLQARGIAPARELREEEKTLSPSDFGFHNAIRRPDGRLVFVDFEYFGWDDPAKLVVDFLFHPAMALPQDLKRAFVTQLLRRFDDQEVLAHRVEVVYPLWGLKWCLILLNEFLPADRLRRKFMQGSPNGHQEVYEWQLAKARQMLQRVMQDYAHIPYLS